MEKTFFNPGDIVKIKQAIAGPEMVVKLINKARFKQQIPEAEKQNMLIGVTCFWFTKNDEYQEKMFSTKDLTLVSDKIPRYK